MLEVGNSKRAQCAIRVTRPIDGSPANTAVVAASALRESMPNIYLSLSLGVSVGGFAAFVSKSEL